MMTMQNESRKRKRLGVLVPAVDVVVEVDFRRHLPDDVDFYTTRLDQKPGSGIGTEDNYRGLIDSAPRAAQSVALTEPDLIAFCCTSASFYRGPNWHWQLSQMIEEASGVPAITTSSAALQALKALGARSIVLASPYPDTVNSLEAEWLRAYGIDVSFVINFGCTRSSEVGEVEPATILAVAQLHREKIQAADVLFCTCTGVRAFDVASEIEADLGRPVITSNSATAWLAMSRLGVEPSPDASGRLFTLEAPAEVPRVAEPT